MKWQNVSEMRSVRMMRIMDQFAKKLAKKFKLINIIQFRMKRRRERIN